MEVEEPVLQGVLLLPPQDMLGKFYKKTWQKKYCLLFKKSNCGIERLEAYNNKEDFLIQRPPHEIFTLEACIKIVPSNQPRSFTVMTKTNTYQFACSTDAETLDWITAFQQVAFKTIPSNPMIEEYNDIYSASDEGIFSVRLVETEASKRCGFEEKHYKLILSNSGIQLMDNGTKLCKWPFRFVRKYGYRDGKFSFEAGRRCASGEGIFLFDLCNEQEIYRCLLLKIRSLKKSMLEPGMLSSSSSTMNLNEAQYNAALSMEAGSRSPLPPTPSSSSDNLTDIDYSLGSQTLQKPLFSTIYNNFSTNSGQFVRLPGSIIKPKPEKPPRKYNLLGHSEAKSDTNYPDFLNGSYRKLDAYTSPELLRKTDTATTQIRNANEKHPYDIVEVRSDAWKTHGLNTVIHTEREDRPTYVTPERNESDINCSARLASDNDTSDNEESDKQVGNKNEEFDEGGSVDNNRRQSHSKNDANLRPTTKDSTPVLASPIIHHNLTDFDSTADYDQLEYFGSLHKLNNKSGYKKIKPFIYGTTGSQISSQTEQKKKKKEEDDADYELIEDVSAIRLADESSRGYGIIKKKPNETGTQEKTKDEYASVDKHQRN